ncbi:MAG: hypothetical protein RBS19_08070 [Bacteroidales bacterium]|nr:hypothetical protein [Bacteroidales bacterium]MDY0216894.1 hypothetical protein [Bacteroidales bacterium]
MQKNYSFDSKLLIFIAFLASVLLFQSCKKELTTWQSDLSVPIASTSFSLSNLMADSLMEVDENQLLILHFKHPLFQVFADSMVAFPDTISSYYFKAFGNGTLSPGQTIISQNEATYFDLGDAQITRMKVFEGKIRLYAINPLTEPLKLVYSIPAASKNNVPFSITEIIPASNGMLPYVHNLLIDIGGYQLDMKGVNGNQFNRLQTFSKLSVYENANTVNVSQGQEFSFYTKFESLTIAHAKGYLGSTLNANGPDTTQLDMFKKLSGGTIELENVDVYLDIFNGIGADLKFKLNDLMAINTKNNHSVVLSGSDVFRFQNITRAKEDGPWLNSYTPSQKSISFSSTNVKELFETLPDKLVYSYDYELNPWGNISGGNDFVYQSSKIEALLNIRLPLSVKISDLCFSDTLDYHVEMDENILQNGKLYVRVANTFPLSFNLKIELLNAQNQTETILLNENSLIQSAIPVSGTTDAVVSLIEIPLNKQQINSLLKNKRMHLFVKANSHHGNTVDLYGFQKMDIKISGDFNINIAL